MRQGTYDSIVERQGNLVVMKNKLYQISYDLSKGTWDYLNQAGQVVIRNAYTKIILKDGTFFTTLEAESRNFITHPITEDDFGICQPIAFSHQPDNRNFRTHVYLNCYDKKPYIVLHAAVENLSGKPVAIDRIIVIGISSLHENAHSGTAGSVYLGGDPSGYRIFLDTNRTSEQAVKPIHDGFSIAKKGSAELFNNGALYDTDTKQSLVFGFLSAQKWSSAVQVGYNSQTRPDTGDNQGINLWSLYNTCQRRPCAQGEVIKSEPAYLNFTSEVTESYQLYVQMLAKRMEAKTLDRVFSGWSVNNGHNHPSITAKWIIEQVNQITQNRLFYPPSAGGIEYILVEDGWQEKVGSWKVNARNFPDGMKPVVDKIHASSLKAGIRLAPLNVNPDAELLSEHPEYFLKNSRNKPALVALHETGTEVAMLDVSHRGAQTYVRARLQQVVNDWKYDLVKVDLSGYAAGPLSEPDNYVWYDQSLTAVELYRLGIQLLNQVIDESSRSVILAGGDICNGPGIGEVPVHSVLSDYRGYIGAEPWNHKAGVKQLASKYAAHLPMHGVAWTGEFGAVVIDEPIPLNEALATITAAGLSGGIVTWGSDFTKLEPARAELLAKLFPLCGQAAAPVDFYESKLPRIWNLRVNAPYDTWNVVGVFNWEDNVDEIYFPLKTLGLDESKYYLIHDFWGREYLGAVRGSVTLLDLPPRSVKLLGIRAEQKSPQLIATDLHFTQGSVEIVSAGWDQRSQSFLAVCKPPRHCKGTLFFHVPEEYVPVATSCYGSNYHFLWNKPIYTLEFSPTSDFVHVSIQFARISG